MPADSSDDDSGSDGEEGPSTGSGGRVGRPMDTLWSHLVETNITSCRQNEICVDGYGPLELWDFDESVAYCVSTQNFVNIAEDQIAHVKADVAGGEGLPADVADITSATKSMGIEAVLTAPDHTSSMYARRMRIRAQSYREAFHTQLWLSLPNGTESCKGCASLDLRPLPVGTKRIAVDIMLSGPGLVTGGLLYLFHVNPQKHL